MTTPAGPTDDQPAPAAAHGTEPGESAVAVAGPFTLREVVVMIAAVVILLGSLIPFAAGTRIVNAWMFSQTQFNQVVFLLAPLLIAIGFAWRRLAGRHRVALFSLTLDQWGSVIGLLAAAYYFFAAVNSMGFSFLLCFVGALALVASTTTAHVVGGFAADFVPGDGYLLAREVKPSAPARSGAPADGAPADGAVFSAPAGDAAYRGPDGPGPETSQDQADDVVPQAAAEQPADESGPRPEGGPFWFAVPEAREAYDEPTGMWAFTIEPAHWVLALADRGTELQVQHVDGRVGVLREIDGIERA